MREQIVKAMAAAFLALGTLFILVPCNATAQSYPKERLHSLGVGQNPSATTGTLITTGPIGGSTATPRRALDILDATTPQLRLTQTDNSKYADLQADSNGDLTITPSGGDAMLNANLGINSTGALPLFRAHFVEAGQTGEASPVITGALATRAFMIQGNGAAYIVGRDLANNREVGLGITWPVTHVGSVTGSDFAIRTGNLNRMFFQHSTTFAGMNTITPRRRLDVLDASAPQLRLTHTDNSVYTDLQTDSGGDLTITPSGGDFNIAGAFGISGQLTSTVTNGTAPFVVASGTAVTNLNADKWDGYHFGDYLDQAVKTGSSPTFFGLNISYGATVLGDTLQVLADTHLESNLLVDGYATFTQDATFSSDAIVNDDLWVKDESIQRISASYDIAKVNIRRLGFTFQASWFTFVLSRDTTYGPATVYYAEVHYAMTSLDDDPTGRHAASGVRRYTIEYGTLESPAAWAITEVASDMDQGPLAGDRVQLSYLSADNFIISQTSQYSEVPRVTGYIELIRSNY